MMKESERIRIIYCKGIVEVCCNYITWLYVSVENLKNKYCK